MVPVDPLHTSSAGDRWEMLRKLIFGSERVSFSRHEQRRHLDVTEVLGAQLLGFAWGMQRIAQQHEAADGEALGSRDRTRPSAKRAPTDDDAGSRYPELLGQALRRLDDLRHGTRHAGGSQR